MTSCYVLNIAWPICNDQHILTAHSSNTAAWLPASTLPASLESVFWHGWLDNQVINNACATSEKTFKIKLSEQLWYDYEFWHVSNLVKQLGKVLGCKSRRLSTTRSGLNTNSSQESNNSPAQCGDTFLPGSSPFDALHLSTILTRLPVLSLSPVLSLFLPHCSHVHSTHWLKVVLMCTCKRQIRGWWHKAGISSCHF